MRPTRATGEVTREADVPGCVGLATRVKTWPPQTTGVERDGELSR